MLRWFLRSRSQSAKSLLVVWWTTSAAVAAQKYVRPGKRATADGEWQFFVSRMETRTRLRPRHLGRAADAIAFERRVCRTGLDAEGGAFLRPGEPAKFGPRIGATQLC